MKAYTLTSYGQDSATTWADVPAPQAGPGQVLIKVRAAGLNPLDAMIARGDFKQLLSYRLPLTLGQEVAGDVLAVGEGVSNFAVGDRVFSRLPIEAIGAFAEEVAVDADQVAPMPEGLTYAQAAGLPLVLLTAIQAFTEKAPIKPGDKVFIQGGTGGLGSIAIQVAKHLGAYVATTVSSKKVELAKSLGADEVIDYRTQNYEDIISGYDIVLDTLGKEETLRSMKVLAPGGKLVTVVGAPDADFASQLGKPFLKPVMWFLSRKERAAAKKLGVNYSFLFMRADGQQLRDYTPALESGAIKPLVAQVLPFDQLEEGLDLLAKRQGGPGKIVVEMN